MGHQGTWEKVGEGAKSNIHKNCSFFEMHTYLGIVATKIMYHTHISRQSVVERKERNSSQVPTPLSEKLGRVVPTFQKAEIEVVNFI